MVRRRGAEYLSKLIFASTIPWELVSWHGVPDGYGFYFLSQDPPEIGRSQSEWYRGRGEEVGGDSNALSSV